MDAIHIEKIRKSFSGKHIVQNASLLVEEGQKVALVGRSGCGKSTLLRMVLGLETPDSGHIHLLGQHIHRLPIPAGVAYLTQRPILLPWMSSISNALLPLALQRTPSADDIADTRALFSSFGLSEAEGVRPQNLSGGMRQRVALIQALSSNPKVLVLDEPFNALDDITRRLILNQLSEWLINRKCTVMMVSHSFEDAAYLCDRVVIWRTDAQSASNGNLVEIDEIPKFSSSHSLSDFCTSSLESRKKYLFERYVSIDSEMTQSC